MSTCKGGLVLESPRLKDFSHELIFGSAQAYEKIGPLGRDTSAIPIIFQGRLNTCVSATITWIRQYLDNAKPDLAHEWLAEISHTGEKGASPSQVLEPARKVGIVPQSVWDSNAFISFEKKVQRAGEYKIPSYFYVTDLSKAGIFHALKSSPLAIGVRNFRGVGAHMMAAYDVSEDGLWLKCKNWWSETEQSEAEVLFQDVVVAIMFGSLPNGVIKEEARLSVVDALLRKINFYLKYVQHI